MATGKRAGARPKRRFRRDVLLLATGATLAVIAWGYLVWAAIDFGSDARGGKSEAWGFLALAAVGAMACLFVALLLGARIMHALATPPSIVLNNHLMPPPVTPPGGQATQTSSQPSHRHRAD